MEKWMPVKGYEKLYEVSSSGVVRSLDRNVRFSNGGSCFKQGKTLKPILNAKGYFKVSLSFENKTKSFRMGRLVAAHFVDNPLNLPEINHKDGNKTNDNDWNLEWSTRADNMKHAYEVLEVDTGHMGAANHKSRPVINTEYGIFYESITEAAGSFGVQSLTLQAQLTGRNPIKYSLRLV